MFGRRILCVRRGPHPPTRARAADLGTLLLTALLMGAAPPDGPASPLPRLAGVVVTPAGRAAIFDTGNGRWTVSAEGDEIGHYTVRSITPGQVILADPGRTYVLTPTPGALAATAADEQNRAEAPVLTAAQAGALESGTSVGGAALRYDSCVERGYLANDGQPAEPQFEAVIAAMAQVPDHDGASGRDMAVWMRFGLDTARRAAAASPYSRSFCQQAAEEWRRAGRRYGLGRPRGGP